VGRIGIGRVIRGRIKSGQLVTVLHGPEGGPIAPINAKVNQVQVFKGLERVVVEEAEAGDIVLINGIEEIGIGVTVTDPEHPEALPLLKVDEPTLTMNFQVNTSPLAGREGKYVTSRQLRERLQRELMSNVALKVQETGDADVFEVSGRGELHLTILLENMRREGYELAVGRPRVVIKEINGEKQEPYEMLTVDVEETNQGAGDGSARRAARRSAGHAVRRQRPRAARLPDSRARADRLPVGIHDHDARHRHHEPRVRRLRPDEARHGGAPQRRADFSRIG
jgi:GTP-binding protein